MLCLTNLSRLLFLSENLVFFSWILDSTTFKNFSTIPVRVASSLSFKSMNLVECEFDPELIDFWLSGPVIVQPSRFLTA